MVEAAFGWLLLLLLFLILYTGERIHLFVTLYILQFGKHFHHLFTPIHLIVKWQSGHPRFILGQPRQAVHMSICMFESNQISSVFIFHFEALPFNSIS